MKYLYLKTCLLPLLLPLTVNAADLSAGGALAVVDPAYRKTGTEILTVPLVNYEYGNFYLRSLNVGYYLFRDGENDLALNAGVGTLRFSPSDSDDSNMKTLDKRRLSVMSGITMNNRFRQGTLRTSVMTDISGNSGGTMADMTWLYPLHSGNLVVTPGFGLNWNDSQYNRYYYGITSSESRRSGMKQYSPGDSVTFSMELSVFYQVNKNWYLTSSVKATELSGTIRQSDMVGSGVATLFVAGAGYHF
ncbi:MipA/OmpV family protein [Enterobacter roggenkampii]|uniref:MipA/OmpV family protein n=1 Tax=Enterobacter roggenkampii TaxID=1812935 RepID=UPI0035179701